MTPEREIEKRIIDGDAPQRMVDWGELWRYRDLFYFLVWRDIKTRYAQSVLGVGWAIIQPVFSMVVFTIVFGNLAKVDSDGVPYAIFSYTALVPWTYFSAAIASATSSLIASSSMLTKVYFPRLIIPLSPMLAKLVDFMISLVILFGLMLWYRMPVTSDVFVLPILVLIMVLTAAGMGMWLTALAVQYRDVNYAMSFVVQLLMYAAPVVYPSTNVPERWQMYYAFNPMVGVIEGFRAALLGTRPIPWDWIAIGTVVAVGFTVSGIWYFKRMERIFADVV